MPFQATFYLIEYGLLAATTSLHVYKMDLNLQNTRFEFNQNE